MFMSCLYNSHMHVLVHHEQLNRCCSPYQTGTRLTENLPLFFFHCLSQDPSEALPATASQICTQLPYMAYSLINALKYLVDDVAQPSGGQNCDN